MNFGKKFVVLGTVFLFATAFAAAQINSSSTTTDFFGVITSPTSPPPGPYPTPSSFTIGSGVATANLNPFGVWAPAIGSSQWVGELASFGPGPGTSNPAYGYYLYGYQLPTFTGTGTLTSLTVLADDTVSVFLGSTNNIITPGDLGTDIHCSDNPPSCTTTLEGVLSAPVSITSGEMLWFIVEQAGIGPVGGTGDPSGVDFSGAAIIPSTTPIPEPSSLLLLGTGLFGSARTLLRRKR